ncbi:hypothetical protein G4B88_007926, partial [Cannabis sativa]
FRLADSSVGNVELDGGDPPLVGEETILWEAFINVFSGLSNSHEIISPQEILFMYQRIFQLYRISKGFISANEFISIFEFAMNPLSWRVLIQVLQEIGNTRKSYLMLDNFIKVLGGIGLKVKSPTLQPRQQLLNNQHLYKFECKVFKFQYNRCVMAWDSCSLSSHHPIYLKINPNCLQSPVFWF